MKVAFRARTPNAQAARRIVNVRQAKSASKDPADPAHRTISVARPLNAWRLIQTCNVPVLQTGTVPPAICALPASVRPPAPRTAIAELAVCARRESAALAQPAVNAVRLRCARTPGLAPVPRLRTASPDKAA